MSDVSQEHIVVAVRMRPMNTRESDQGDHCSWKCNSELNCIHEIDDKGATIPNSIYSYDYVFGPEATTETVYQGLGKRIVESFVKGINGTIFAYGQTSSGKTYTMHGDESSPGLLYLASKDIFDYIAKTTDREFILRGSYVELYKEEVKDLLDPSTPSLRIRESYERGVYVESKEEVIHNYSDLLNLLHTGDKYRHMGTTNMNQQSSRSHTIFKIVCESRLREEFLSSTNDSGGVLVGQLSLVDLAGSESVRYTGAKGETLEEAKKINLSLSVLSRVISALASRTENSHVSYRDSKLTRLLQSSLDGNSRTAIIACVTPASTFCNETISTLKFAQRAKNVHTSAQVNELLDDKAVIRKLKKELEQLKQQLRQQESVKEKQGDTEMEVENQPSLQEKDRELTEAQNRLEDLHRNICEKEILLQQHVAEKSSIEAELVLSQARECEYQKKLSEALTHVDELKKKIEEEVMKRQASEEQSQDLSLQLQQSVEEIEKMRKRDIEWWIESKRFSQNTSQTSESDNGVDNTLLDMEDVRTKILNEMEELKSWKKEKQQVLKNQEDLIEQLKNQLNEVNEKKNILEKENQSLSQQVIKIVPELTACKKENEVLKKDIEMVEEERDHVLIEKEELLSEKEKSGEEMRELQEYIKQLKEKLVEGKRIEETYENERESLRNEKQVLLLEKEQQEKEMRRLSEISNQSMNTIEELKRDCEEKEEEKKRLIEEVNSMKEEGSVLIADVERIRAEQQSISQSCQSAVLSLQEEIEKKTREIEELKKVNDSLQHVQQEQQEQIKQIEILTQQINEKEQLVNQYKEQEELKEKEKQELQKQIEKLEEMKKQLELDLSNKNEIIHALEMQTALADQKEKKLTQQWQYEVKELKQKKGEIDRLCIEYENQINSLKQSIEEKEKAIQSSKDYVEQIRLQLRTLEAVIQSNDDEIDELKACVVVGDDDIDRLKKTIIEQKKKLSQEKATIYNQLQSDFDIYKQELAAGYTQDEMMMLNMREENKSMKGMIEELKERLAVEQNTYEAKIRELEEMNPSRIEEQRSTISSFDYQDKEKEKEELKQVKEENEKIQQELKESEEKITRLKQTIRSKYSEYKEMSNYVNTTKEANEVLMKDLEVLKKKYSAAKSRIAALEKCKLSTEDMERIRQLLITKEAKDKEIKDLRRELSKYNETIHDLNEQKKELSNRLNESLNSIGEKDARIDELENDLKEAKGSAVGLYGSSKEYLENENLKMSIRIEDLEETIKELRSELKQNQSTPNLNESISKAPSFQRKNRRREETSHILQSPSKQNKLSDYDLDDVSKCNPQ